MRADDRGSVTIWMLGLCLALLAFGGLALDFWRGLALQRELAAMADSAAIAAASGIDEERYRSTGEVVLQPDRARALAVASIGFQSVDPEEELVVFDASGTSVTVEVAASLDLGLLALLVDDSEPLLVRASASAVPVLVP
jgi:Flp pilus assembly protein TadG